MTMNLDGPDSIVQDSLTQFFNLSHDILLIINTDGTFNRLSPSFTKLLGYTKQDLDGAILLDFSHPEKLPHFQKQWADILDGEVCVYYKSLFLHKKGNYICVEWRAILSLDENRIYAVGRITDE